MNNNKLTQARSEFVNKTNHFSILNFEGFDFEVGDKRFKYKISNPSAMAEAQNDVSKILLRSSDKTGNIVDMNGYHKALYAARKR